MPAKLSEATTTLVQMLRRAEERHALSKEGMETIHVSHITRGLGFLYERVRNTLDYKEESLWAKNAVRRILRRKELQFLSGDALGLGIIQELIRGRYLENDAVSETVARDVDAILAKYRALWYAAFPEKVAIGKKERALADWVLGIAACEIEEVVRRNPREALLFQFLYQALRGRVTFPEGVDEDTARLQLYLSSFRAMFQADTDMESWMLWRMTYPEWSAGLPNELVEAIGSNLGRVKARIESSLRWPFRQSLDRLVQRKSVLVLLLGDILSEGLAEAETVLTADEALEAKLRQVYEKRYRENRAKLRRTAFRAVLFIFLTKVLLALGPETWYDRLTTGRVDRYVLSLNILLPPVILMIASLSIRMPGEGENFSKVLLEFNRLLSTGEEPIGAVRSKKSRKVLLRLTLGILTLVNFAVTFGILLWFVRTVGFNVLSAAIFILFLSIVSFFAIRLRKTANELAAVEETEHWARQLFDFLVFPIVEIGRIVSWSVRSLNVVVILFDFFLEAPFHTFLGVLEEWFSFLRERKESL